MWLLGYAHGIHVTPSDISPDMIGASLVDNFVWLANLKVGYHGRGVDAQCSILHSQSHRIYTCNTHIMVTRDLWQRKPPRPRAWWVYCHIRTIV